jgi:hypothetical protein
MATVIPVTGETVQVEPPDSLQEVDRLIAPSVPIYARRVWSNGDSTFIFSDLPNGIYNDIHNVRATRFIVSRGGAGESVYGSALFLSSEEWGQLEASEVARQSAAIQAHHQQSVWAKIPGDTYPIKEQLKGLGGKWDATAHTWIVPAAREQEALKLVALQAAKTKLVARNRGTSNGPAQEVDGAPRLNSLPGKCHLCGTSIAAKQGSLFYVAKTPGARKTGWLVECLPSQGCKSAGLPAILDEEGIFGVPPRPRIPEGLDDEEIFREPSRPMAGKALVADKGIEDLFEDAPKQPDPAVEFRDDTLDRLLDEEAPF